MQGHLERQQLAALVAVGEELHFGRAADRLGLQQPAPDMEAAIHQAGGRTIYPN
jgi:hypothetical protein